MKSLSLARPHAIMMVGIPGSGKTFFARQFADTFNAPFIDANSIAAHAKDDESTSILTGLMVEQVAKTGQTFIYEGNTDSRTHRTEFAKWARTKGYQPMLIWVQTDQRTSEERSHKQKGISSEDFKYLLRSFSAPHRSEQPIVISGKHTYASQAKVVLGHLAKNHRPSSAATTPERQAAPSAGRTIQVR